MIRRLAPWAPPQPRRGLLLAGVLALAASLALSARAQVDQRPPSLGAQADSLPPLSEPAPLLIPGRPNPADTTVVPAATRARQEFDLARRLERTVPATSIVTYRKALRLDPTLRDANYRIGLLFNTRWQWGEARKSFLAELASHPDHLDARRELALTMSRMGETAQAIALLDSLAKRLPRDGRIWHALGFAHTQAGQTRLAERALRRAIQLPPKDVEEHRDLGALLAASGRANDARAQYRLALAVQPNDPGTWLNLGNLERRSQRPEPALDAYRHAVAGDSSFTPGYQGQIQVLRDLGRLDEAARVYGDWLRRKPEEHGARLEAVQMLLEMKRPDDALALAQQGLETTPRSGQARLIYGMALAGQGRSREALAALRQAQDRFGRDAEERSRVESMIEALRRAAPDSLRSLFHSDSVSHAARR